MRRSWWESRLFSQSNPHGRFELGIGVGAFWDAIEAMGGWRLTPGQSIEALEEAIQIMREIWATDKPGGVPVNGTYYQVNGAKRGPRPAHPIGIWIGALKPRILNLIGRVADGWLPSGHHSNGLRSLRNSRSNTASLASFLPQMMCRRLSVLPPKWLLPRGNWSRLHGHIET